MRKIHQEFKEYDGGTLKLKDPHQRRTFYFEMDYNYFQVVYKSLKKRKLNKYYILSSNSHPRVFDTLEEIKEELHIVELYIGQIIHKGPITYGICDKSLLTHLCENMMCPKKDSPKQKEKKSFTYKGVSSYSNPPSNQPSSKRRTTSTKKVDWDERYEEGIDIFGNEDEAEAYADNNDI